MTSSAPTRDATVARVTGPRTALDPREHVIRADLVDIAFADCIAAAAYVSPVAMCCTVPRTAMRGRDNPAAVATSELLAGEGFRVFEVAGDWAFGQAVADGYTGWVPAAALADGMALGIPVTAAVAPVFSAPDIKAPLLAELPFGARVAGSPEGAFLALDGCGFVHRRHLEALVGDPVAIARRFLGAPYLWGGRTPLGVDCSGLVQAALTACGHACPRDSDLQRARLGVPVAFDDRAAGDLVFFPGHVGMLSDGDTLLHANAYWMATVIEPLADVIARLVAAGTEVPVTGVRRLISPA